MDKIIVALDISDESEEIIRCAVKMAKAFSSSIYLVHVELPVRDASGLNTSSPHDEIVIEHKEDVEKLSEYANQLRQQGIETHAIVITGISAQSILDEAHNIGADLIVMGSHRHSLIESVFTGGVGKAVVRNSECPILLVPTIAL